MSREDIESLLRDEKRSTRSIDSQMTVCHYLWQNGFGPNAEGPKKKEVEDEVSVEFSAGTCLTHLEDVGLVEEYSTPGPEVYVIAEWMNAGEGEIINGEVSEAAREGLEALVEELESGEGDTGPVTAATDGSGETLRSVIADEFDLVPEKVESFLSQVDEPVKVLNSAVDAIAEAEGIETGEGYGSIEFINSPYRYRLTETAVAIYEK